MTKPSPSLLNQQSHHVLGVCDVGDFVRPEYLHYLSDRCYGSWSLLMSVSVILQNNVGSQIVHSCYKFKFGLL
jgi:hypothetical protein